MSEAWGVKCGAWSVKREAMTSGWYNSSLLTAHFSLRGIPNTP